MNDIIRDIVQSHVRKHPLLTAAEVEVLFQSNYQLLSIGRNLNQIARQLNMGEGVSLTSEQINALSQFIRQHTQRVSDVLRTNRKRLSE
ncbi:plasmid mobilization relaxosome protein MobC [Neisseria subflava]|uniref:plasmid mobilization relaxosome protein MobC n=1 Tax=Neisseria subflava TaxID=28449 RepID=UPI0024A8349F|nr:plasmid mobilization relaxosome protein MobC [Neisseria subflava]